MIDVGRKVVHHQLKGFMAGGIASYLTTFNLAPRQIWITRHGESTDNAANRIGGDAELTEQGKTYASVLHSFITLKRREWRNERLKQARDASFPPTPGDATPPYPGNFEPDDKNFCVWTSMLQRSIRTADHFDWDEDYDTKEWYDLNEIHAGDLEGLTYAQIAKQYPEEFAKRKADKLGYVYPGVGGEGYLQVINRLKDMVREVERITDHVLIIGHRSVCRILMAYFMDLTRDKIAELDVPLGMLYVIEPKPYGMEFHSYKYNDTTRWFDELRGYKPQRESQT
jgi:6-phosphofructo-2-kinase